MLLKILCLGIVLFIAFESFKCKCYAFKDIMFRYYTFYGLFLLNVNIMLFKIFCLDIILLIIYVSFSCKYYAFKDILPRYNIFYRLCFI